MNIVEKLADIIVTLLGTGLGWFLANTFYYKQKRCAFYVQAKYNIKRRKAGDVNFKNLRFTFKNESHVDAYDIVFTIYFNDGFQSIEKKIPNLKKYETVEFEDSFISFDDEPIIYLDKHIDYLRFKYITEYGYAKVYTKSAINKFEIDEIARKEIS
ncbi:hypothetical protein [Sphingobacterium chungjuense]|uniref:hypothetical protein n=1 Tax=Sphingobacterium chungjuense TaxID=2675553 RepID=UPI0014076BA8|nr:hypothetical protein [Sphingobacterium chungjuense]